MGIGKGVRFSVDPDLDMGMNMGSHLVSGLPADSDMDLESNLDSGSPTDSDMDLDLWPVECSLKHFFVMVLVL